jgi:hypothetical protein
VNTFKIQFDNSPGYYYEECVDGFLAEDGLWESFCQHFENLFAKNSRNDLVVCGCCGSSSLSSASVYREVNRLKKAYYYSKKDDELFDYFIDFVSDIANKITHKVDCTDEEWLSYMINGTPDIEFIYDDNGKAFQTDFGDFLTFGYKEVLFQLNADCESCSQTVFK